VTRSRILSIVHSVRGVRGVRGVTGLLALAARAAEPSPPPDAEVHCGPIWNGHEQVLAWGTREPHTGLHYQLARFDRAGRRLGEPIELGWGYEGHPACVVGWNRERWAIVWAFADPYGGSPELHTAIVERGRSVAQHAIVRTPTCWQVHPVALTPAGSGWIVSYRCDPDAPIERVPIDRDGRRR
jgi:hypothetical protein